jgi:hypothetical protein
MNNQATMLAAATGVDPVADAVSSLATLSVALGNINNSLLAMAAPTPADVTAIQTQVANISADLVRIQTKLAAQGGGGVTPGTPTTPTAPAEPQISAQAAALVAIGALAVGGIGAYLIWGRKSGSGKHGKRGASENPTDARPKRRRIRKTGRRYVSKEPS